ncbi:DUF2461 domain-containing protein [Flavobacterium sp. RHBU_3]|uniref:DUF2461 domain-containing protein n=1 Tax=Flavobacterium sp. RHBU_3 TaxID=3391184 RepID=UPI003985438B
MITTTTLQFLEDLRENNYRDWFQAHQDRYADYKKDYKATTEAFIAEMGKYDEAVSHLEFKDCSFRINRDIRFSKDKAPYKTNMGIWMYPGAKHDNLAGYYMHIEKGKSFIAGGLYCPQPDALKKVRREIDGFYEDLEEVVANNDFKTIFKALSTEDALKTTPKGFEKDHPAAEFLKLKSFIAQAPISDKELLSKNFIQNTVAKLAVLKPLNDFLNRGLTTEE